MSAWIGMMATFCLSSLLQPATISASKNESDLN
jgi:hypothetical protein